MTSFHTIYKETIVLFSGKACLWQKWGHRSDLCITVWLHFFCITVWLHQCLSHMRTMAECGICPWLVEQLLPKQKPWYSKRRSNKCLSATLHHLILEMPLPSVCSFNYRDEDSEATLHRDIDMCQLPGAGQRRERGKSFRWEKRELRVSTYYFFSLPS